MNQNSKAMNAALRGALAAKHADLRDALRRSSGVMPAQPQVDAASPTGQPAPAPAGHAGIGAYQQPPPSPPSMNDWLRAGRYRLPAARNNGIITMTV